MTFGEGKYDHLCEAAMKAAKANHGAILIIFDGEHGSGCSIKITPPVMDQAPELLRMIADSLAADNAAFKGRN